MTLEATYNLPWTYCPSIAVTTCLMSHPGPHRAKTVKQAIIMKEENGGFVGFLLFVLLLWGIPSCARDFLLAQCSGITPGSTQGTIWETESNR